MSLRWSSATDQLYAVSNSSPSLDLDFASNKSLLDNISGNNLVTFRRASTGTYVDSDGLIKTSPVNLLYNTTTYSNWINSGQSIQTNAAISPSGLNDAVKLVADASAGGKISYRSATTTTTNVCSVYVKAGEYTNIQLRELSAARFYVNFDLSAGTYAVPQSGSAPAGGFDFISADIQDVGNGWYRCIVVNSRVVGLAFSIAGYPNSASVATSNPNFTGDGTSGVYIWGAQVEEGSTATDYIPTTTTISGAPRFDHDPVTGESLGLLIEESRTNLLQYSEQFDQSAWIKSAGASIIPNATSSPDGSQTADKQVGASEANWFICTQFPSVVVSGVYTGSIYAKAGGFRYLRVLDSQGTNKYFDLETGDTSGMEDAGNGWYRCSWTVTATATPYNYRLYVTDNNTGAQPTGDGVKGIYIWGAQLEAGSFPTSYIPTTSSTVTRAADVASIEGTNFSSWYNQSEGTVFVAVDKAYKTNTIAAAFDDGSGANRIEVRSSGSSLSNARYVITDNSTTVYSKESSTAGANRLKLALAYKTGSVNNATNGVIDIVDATASIPNVSRLAFQNEFFLTDQRPGHIARLAYFPTRKTDQELIDLTT